MKGLLMADLDIQACEDVFGQVDMGRSLGDRATVGRPEAVHEVRVAVMHSDREEFKEPLDQRAEGPLRVRHDLPHKAMLPGKDVLPEADDPGLKLEAVIVISFSQSPTMETLQHNGNLKGLPRIAAHVGIHHLHIVALSEAERPELVSCLALGQVSHSTDQEATCPGEHMNDLNGPGTAGASLPIPDEDAGMPESHGGPRHTSVALFRGKGSLLGHMSVNHLLQLWVTLTPLKVNAHEEWIACVLRQHVMHIVLSLRELRLLQPCRPTVHGAV
mmetsp:Transcript_361/g.974  ORF Transcript_361/g.974 Transcript_361/m.974 type:complete len:273 (-) Transcript_361:5116-5934(-)